MSRMYCDSISISAGTPHTGRRYADTAHIGASYTALSDSRAARVGVASVQRRSVSAMQKRILAFAVLAAVSILVVLGGSIRAFASSQSTQMPLHKYYTSIQVEKGDSLWSIADDYIADGVMTREDFIDEVCTLNHISRQDNLRSGEHLVVMYYSEAAK